jgi:glutathione synthase/RimK-type ligase-like ATP-grasp enzyme
MVLHRENIGDVARLIGFPCILKLPDSSFSQGVLKASDEGELILLAEKMMQSSALLVVQEFVPTEFDWRVGILDGKPLYACKYYMAAEHWQIYNNQASGTKDFTGNWETLRVEDAPKAIVQTALRAANLLGKSLYGVDLKEIKGKPSIIEVNDNPNIDTEVEDLVLGDTLYDRVMEVFNQRLLERTALQQKRFLPPPPR